MSIQANLNQLLTTGAIGAGLYAQTPAAKEKREVKGLKRTIAQKQTAGEQQMENEDFPTSPEAKKQIEQEVRETQRLAELRPTPENIKQAEQARELRDTLAELREGEQQEKKRKMRARRRTSEERQMRQDDADEAAEQRIVQATLSYTEVDNALKERLTMLRERGHLSNRTRKHIFYELDRMNPELAYEDVVEEIIEED